MLWILWPPSSILQGPNTPKPTTDIRSLPCKGKASGPFLKEGSAKATLTCSMNTKAAAMSAHRNGNWLLRTRNRSEEHTSELQSLMRISYAVFCLKKKQKNSNDKQINRKIDNQHKTAIKLVNCV